MSDEADRIARLAVAMMAADPKSDCTREERRIMLAWLLDGGGRELVHDSLKGRILAYCLEYRPRIWRCVEEALAAVQGRTTSHPGEEG